MNMPRMLILAVAAIAAGAAAFLARGFLGGGTSTVSARPGPPPIATSEVLVASSAIQPGQPLNRIDGALAEMACVEHRLRLHYA